MERRNLEGIGGWLSLLLAGMTVLGPLMAIGSGYRMIQTTESAYPVLQNSSVWAHYKVWYWGTIAAAILVSEIGGFSLVFGKTARSVLIAKICLWISGPIISLFLNFGLTTWVAHVSLTDNEVAETLGSLVGPFLAAIVWTVYLSKSYRVRNTYKTWPPGVYPAETVSIKIKLSTMSRLWRPAPMHSEGLWRLCVVTNVFGIAATLIGVVGGIYSGTAAGWIAVVAGLLVYVGCRVLTWIVAGFSKPR